MIPQAIKKSFLAPQTRADAGLNRFLNKSSSYIYPLDSYGSPVDSGDTRSELLSYLSYLANRLETFGFSFGEKSSPGLAYLTFLRSPDRLPGGGRILAMIPYSPIRIKDSVMRLTRAQVLEIRRHVASSAATWRSALRVVERVA